MLIAVKIRVKKNCKFYFLFKLVLSLGNSPNDNAISATTAFIDNAYSCQNWRISFFYAKTSLPANTATRSPG